MQKNRYRSTSKSQFFCDGSGYRGQNITSSAFSVRGVFTITDASYAALQPQPFRFAGRKNWEGKGLHCTGKYWNTPPLSLFLSVRRACVPTAEAGAWEVPTRDHCPHHTSLPKRSNRLQATGRIQNQTDSIAKEANRGPTRTSARATF